MKLIKIFAHGFKSFAEPITLSFDGSVVGIIGPNGSGKSNINDAIKWVLGEQSSKSLRGDSMADVIFAGSQKVKEQNRAIVTLTFDNSQRSVSIPTDIIKITRELNRGEGKNKYYINDELVRYKDIKSIVFESGISKSSLAIISQGTVSDIAEATPESRRLIFEEAAGVSKYKFRKIETERRLANTQASLDQIRIIISELEKQLEPLKRKADKALVYLEKSRQLKEVEVGLLVVRLNFFKQELVSLESKLEGVKETRDSLEENISNSESILNNTIKERLQNETAIQEINKSLEKINSELTNLQIISSNEQQRRELIISGQIKVTEAQRKEAVEAQLNALNTRIRFFQSQTESLEGKVTSNRESVFEIEKNINGLRIEANKEIKRINQTSTKISILKDHLENRTNIFKGVKTVLEHRSLFKGMYGLVLDVFEISEEYAVVIETILANALQHIVVDTSDVATKAIKFLKENNGGRATFIPLKSIRERRLPKEHLIAISGHPGLVGVAADLVSTTPQFDILRKALLGNILVVEDITVAKNLDNFLKHRYMIATLDGDVIKAGGVITGGTSQATTNFIGLQEQIDKLLAIIPTLEENKSRLNNEILIKEAKRQNYVSIISEFTIEKTKIQTNLEIDLKRFNELKAEYKTISSEKLELDEEDVDLIKRKNDLEAEQILLNVEKRAKSERVATLNVEFNRLSNEKLEFEKSLRNLDNSFSKVIRSRDKAKFIIENNHKRLSEFYNMTLELATEKYTLDMPEEEAEAIVSKLTQEIKNLGSVDLESIKSYEEISERYNELKENEAEISETKVKFESAILALDKTILERMGNTMEEINREFNIVFRKMFGGGQASTRFSDENDMLNSGVEIYAQPPGKSIKNLKLFSGGEKSLIAISLLFAILKSRPLALCILDEVEAALDESNVIRYAEYLQELKDKTQFIVITHRHGTMSRVDQLFGVTMQTRGVTSFFSIKLEDAKELVANERVTQ